MWDKCLSSVCAYVRCVSFCCHVTNLHRESVFHQRCHCCRVLTPSGPDGTLGAVTGGFRRGGRGGVFLMAARLWLIRVHVPLDGERPAQLPPPSRRTETTEDRHVKTSWGLRLRPLSGEGAGPQSRRGGGGAEGTKPDFIPTSFFSCKVRWVSGLIRYSFINFLFYFNDRICRREFEAL